MSVSDPVDFNDFGLDANMLADMMKKFQTPQNENKQNKQANNQPVKSDNGSKSSSNAQIKLDTELDFMETYNVLARYSVYKGEYCDNPIIGTGTVGIGKDMFENKFIRVGIQYYAPHGAREYTLQTIEFTIPEFFNKRRLDSHEVVPVFDPESSEDVASLIARGTRFVDFTQGPYYAHANGYMYVPIRGGFKRLPIDSRVVIDPDGYKKDHANRWFSKDTMAEIPDTYIYATMPTVPVFSLEYRAWGEVPVFNLGDIQFDKTAFDRTVLPQTHRDTISPLVKHFYNTNCLDFIAGKKKGLVFLLGGKPGTGKTLTASAIAELNEKPLYCIGSGDLGTSPDLIDNNLKKIFDMVEKWGGMVLIDEADVFMSRRTDYNIDYNACVSVFLRLIENYTGILFLTTNKEHVKIDNAFDSRIHIRLHYHELDADGRGKVWSEALTRYKINDIDINAIKVHKLNNREIANIVQLAYVAVGGDETKVTTQKILDFITLRLSFDPSEDYGTIGDNVSDLIN